MKGTINKQDIDRIKTLKYMNEDMLDLLKAQEDYVKHLVKHFQNDKYYETNFFKDGTLESKIYNFIDVLSLGFIDKYSQIFKLQGQLEYFLDKIKEERK